MCLISKSRESLIANEDIPCVKVFLKGENGKLMTPFTRKEVMGIEYGKPLSAEGEKKIVPIVIHGLECESFIIDEGFMHTYKPTEKLLADFKKYISEGKVFMSLCYIPKGSNYYEDRLEENTYASDSLVFLEEVTDIIHSEDDAGRVMEMMMEKYNNLKS